MSCINCENKNSEEQANQYPCPCDNFVHPIPLNIGAGLNKLPRQIATFSEYRRAMLRSLKAEQVEIVDKNNQLVKIIPLSNWRARDKDDLGIMLLEMWAYICDSLSFYDEVIANESYLRTSSLRPNLRRLVDLLGYLPRPAVGSVVELAAIADGRLQVKLPACTAFQSGAFERNPPQVFEITDDTNIHPFTNRIGILSPHKGIVNINNPASLLVELKGEIKEDALLLLINKNEANEDQNSCLVVKSLEKQTGVDGKQYNKLSFTTNTNLNAGEKLENLQLMKPTQSAGLWTASQAIKSIDGKKITLNILSDQIKPGDYIVMIYEDKKKLLQVKKWFQVNDVKTVMAAITSKVTINKKVFKISSAATPVTELTLNADVNAVHAKLFSPYGNEFSEDVVLYPMLDYTRVMIYYGMQIIAKIIDEPNTTLFATDQLYFNQFVEVPVENYNPDKFLLQDKNTIGVSVGGRILYDQKKLIIDQINDWNQPLTLPVEVYGNVITASRGEKVENEIMGSGDASVSNQTFKLQKKPLTYHLSPTVDNDQGVKSTLDVFVNGMRWTEVNSFFGKNEFDEVYIIRQNDDGESLITFGDGIRGQRLPTGTDNVKCNYRFGAEAACPPPDSINQITKPVKDLQSVMNVLSAFGGADAEDAENIRKFAPRSALILGRVVSMKDMEALASSFPGVRAVQTEWRWDKNKQRASAHIFYIGDEGIRTELSKRLRSVSDPTTPITVEKALSYPLNLSLSAKIDPRFAEQDILRDLRQALINTRSGLLAPENIGIGLPLYRSRIFEAVLKIKGTESVQSLFKDGENFNNFAILPGTGCYLDIEKGKLIINGKEN